MDDIDRKIYEEFENACEEKDYEYIEFFIKKYNINVNSDNGYYLSIISERSDISLMELMYKYGCDIDINNNGVVRRVAHRGDLKMLDYLIREKKAKYEHLFNSTALTNYKHIENYIRNLK